MPAVVDFSPGPSELYFTVHDHMKAALRERIPSLSHRSKSFEKLFQSTCEGLRSLLAIPNNFHIFFTASATEIWERSIQNLVHTHSSHYVNGAFAKRYYETSAQLGKKPFKIDIPEGNGIDESHIQSLEHRELIAVTHNETSTGAVVPLEYIYAIKEKNPDSLLVVDAVSSLPYPAFDYSKIDSVFFSVQKGFGLPAGLGVWLVNDKCLAKAEALQSSGVSIGSYHSLISLHDFAKKNQTPETPNVLNLYLLNKVIEDMLQKGVQTIRRETEYKAAILYMLLETNQHLKPFVKDKLFQSKTVIVCEGGSEVGKISTSLRAKGIKPGDGYGAFKRSHLRFANFPTHSREQFELLVDSLQQILD